MCHIRRIKNAFTCCCCDFLFFIKNTQPFFIKKFQFFTPKSFTLFHNLQIVFFCFCFGHICICHFMKKFMVFTYNHFFNSILIRNICTVFLHCFRGRCRFRSWLRNISHFNSPFFIQSNDRLRPGNTIRIQTILTLEIFHSLFCIFTENPIHNIIQISTIYQHSLHIFYTFYITDSTVKSSFWIKFFCLGCSTHSTGRRFHTFTAIRSFLCYFPFSIGMCCSIQCTTTGLTTPDTIRLHASTLGTCCIFYHIVIFPIMS